MAKVIMYTTPYCVYCRATKEFFEKNNVAFQERDVARDEKAREEMLQKSGQMGVPVIDIGGEIVVGFDKERLSELLGIA